jgi:hypothetical protein
MHDVLRLVIETRKIRSQVNYSPTGDAKRNLTRPARKSRLLSVTRQGAWLERLDSDGDMLVSMQPPSTARDRPGVHAEPVDGATASGA